MLSIRAVHHPDSHYGVPNQPVTHSHAHVNQLIGNTSRVQAVCLLKWLVSTELYRESLSRLLCKSNFASCADMFDAHSSVWSFQTETLMLWCNTAGAHHLSRFWFLKLILCNNMQYFSLLHFYFLLLKNNVISSFLNDITFYLLNLVMKDFPYLTS